MASLSVALNANNKDAGLSPAVSSVQSEAAVGVSLWTPRPLTHLCSSSDPCDCSSALARAWPQAVSDSRFMLETVLSTAVWCGCDLNWGILWVWSFLLAFCGCSYRAAAMVGTVVGMRRRTNGLICSPCFSIPHSTVTGWPMWERQPS